MADLDPLIRVRRHAVEQKQKFLAELYRQAEELSGQKAKLQEQYEEEQKLMNDLNAQLGMGVMNYFGAYSDAVHDRVEEIEGQMVKLNNRIEMARDDIRQAFEALKKIEITAEERKKEEQAEIDKKEDAELGEIAIEGFRRKGED